MKPLLAHVVVLTLVSALPGSTGLAQQPKTSAQGGGNAYSQRHHSDHNARHAGNSDLLIRNGKIAVLAGILMRPQTRG